ncbi:MAG: TaqI-like C-terminal specificity domain-containing protein [Bacteroidota bacterium]
MSDKQSACYQIENLIKRFDRQYESYKSSEYNETLTRRDFIDPFFTALGWDMENKAGHSEAYREVIHEDKLKISGATKAPDYSFRLSGGKRLFFVEAKKPGVRVKEDIQPAYQVRRYGWSAKHPVSIITDFEEFSVYDCTKKPVITDKPSVARIKYLTYREYLNEFDFLWDTFSRDAVVQGSFDKFLAADKNKRGTASVDKEFLESLNRWRTYLATNISWNNRNLDEDEINFAVQQTIDRIIFLRIAEDRSVEPYESLKHALREGGYYRNIFDLFRTADEKYNSGLFDLKKDKICSGLTIDNKVIKNIIQELYYPECPYEFSVMPVEILGSVYEQFLGKVIRITPARHAKIEEKPEVRKAGGVYYTPQFIVDYIVKKTVGSLTEGKTPKQISNLKIVDPACGSGSFLLGAFQFLLDYHKDYYSGRRGITKGRKESPLTPDGHLSTAEKKRILINNIYGVDLDSNAVEVTKLSLLLKCLEGETEASVHQQFRIWNERMLPSLESNIKCGNSLIDTDFYDGMNDSDEEKKIKPFSWKNTFPEVFNAGGFDAVIGNPPYVRQELLGAMKSYFQQHYRVYHGMADLYSYFIEKSMSLLNQTGLYGVIVANKWMRAGYGKELRKFLGGQDIREIIDFGDLPVFETATTYPSILIVGKSGKRAGKIKLTIAKTLSFSSLEKYIEKEHQNIKRGSLDENGWNLAGEKEQLLLQKIRNAGIPLGEYVKGKIFRGVLTGMNEAFVIDGETKSKLIKEDKRSREIIKPFLTGRDIKRYQKPESSKHLIMFPKGFTNQRNATKKHAWEWLKENYSAIADYLEPFKVKAEKRFDKGYYWWELRACDYYAEFEKPKIIYPNILKRPEFTFDPEGIYTNQKCFIISKDDKYLLGLLNSKIFSFLFDRLLPKLRGGFYEPSYIFFKDFPIKQINHTDSHDKNSYEKIITLVKEVLKLNEQVLEIRLSQKQYEIFSKIEHCEQRIDEVVYQLYGLTEEEIRIVEGK